MILHTHTHTNKDNDAFSLHLQQMECFLKRILETGITIKLKKCKFAHREIKFCGKIVGSGGKKPDPGKVAAIKDLRPARTKTEVRRLLGLFGFFRDHIPKYAKLAKPLTDLTSKHVPNVIPWDECHTAALNQLKQALCDATDCMLYATDFDKPFNIRVDASDNAVAGYLSQTKGDGIEYPLAFF